MRGHARIFFPQDFSLVDCHTVNRVLRATAVAAAIGLTARAIVADAQNAATPDELAQNPDSFLVPPPEAVCNALAKVPNVDFTKLAGLAAPPIDVEKMKAMSPSAKAVHLGVRAADAYVAVQAKDQAAFVRASDAISTLSREFALNDTMFRKITTANKMAESGRWNDLRIVLETFRGDVLRELKLNRDQDAVTLATFGGWLRGLQLSTLALAAHYDADATRLLRQPALVAHLKRRLNALGPDAKEEAFVELAENRIEDIRKITDGPASAPIKADDVKRLNGIANELMGAL